MNAFHSISSWWKRFSRKRRLSMLNATDNVEEWYTHISPAGLLAAFLAFALLLFILLRRQLDAAARSTAATGKAEAARALAETQQELAREAASSG